MQVQVNIIFNYKHEYYFSRFVFKVIPIRVLYIFYTNEQRILFHCFLSVKHKWMPNKLLVMPGITFGDKGKKTNIYIYVW